MNDLKIILKRKIMKVYSYCQSELVLYTFRSTCVTKRSTFQFSYEKQHVCIRYYENYHVSVFAAKSSTFERFVTKSSMFRLYRRRVRQLKYLPTRFLFSTRSVIY